MCRNCLTSNIATMNSELRVNGFVTRIMNGKYGFIDCRGEVLFFHISEVPCVEDIACMEVGSVVSFQADGKDMWAKGHNKRKAVKVRLGQPYRNVYKNWSGDIQNGFCGDYTDIQCKNGQSVLLHAGEVVGSTTARSGKRVRHEVAWNYNYTPARPHAKNVCAPDVSTSGCLATNLNGSSVWMRNLQTRGVQRDGGTDHAHHFDSRGGRVDWLGKRPGGKRVVDGVWKRGETRMDVRTRSFTNYTCKYGARCTRSNCWYTHPTRTARSTMRVRPSVQQRAL